MKPFLPTFLKSPAPSIGTRWAYAHDAPTLSLIDSYSPHPWDAAEIRKALCKGCIGVVAELHGLCGFAVFLERPYEVELLRIAVSPSYRRRGIGRRLIAHEAERLNTKRQQIVTCVRDSDLDTHLFLRSCRFKAGKLVAWNAYPETGEDGYWFSMRPEAAS